MSDKQTRGRAAEDQALDHLSRNGLKLVERNFRCRQGEIDLIMEDSSSLVFVEVRYRKSASFGGSAESVDFRKQQKVATAAAVYLQQNPKRSQQAARFDVVAITANQLEWIKDAFQL